MLTLKKDLQSTSIHPVTGQALDDGTLPAGTKVYSRSGWRRVRSEFDGRQYVQFKVKDQDGFAGLEEALEDDLEAALR